MEQELKNVLNQILKSIPNDVNVSAMEGSLDTIERSLDKQNDIFERIAESLENIENNISSSKSISTDYIESLLDRLNDKSDNTIEKFDNLYSVLTDIKYNTEQ